MISLFRNFFKSKVGIFITLAFLGLIALAFASMDVSNTATFGGVAGGDRVAVVGDRRIDASELSVNATNALNQLHQSDPTLTMEAFIAAGGMEQVLGQTLSRAALAEFGREHGLRAGKRLVDSEIRQIPVFRDASGNFSEDAYRAALRQQGLSDAMVREDLSAGLFARQVVMPVGLAPQVPPGLARQYARLARERREGAIGLIPSGAFAPQSAPSNAQLQTYYQQNRGRYLRPERRVIRYATFGEEALGGVRAPTDAEVAARYRRDGAQYAAQEDRRLTQVIAPSRDVANRIAAAARSGSLEAAARAQGLATTSIGPVSREALARGTSAEVAEAAFAVERGAVAEPVRGALGWYVLRVDAVDKRPARSLAQVRGEITEALAAEQRATALGDLTARIEEELDDGRGLSEVARELKLELKQTRPVTAAGQVFGTSEAAPEVLAPAIETAFAMDEEEPQLAVLEPGKRFLVFDVTDITPSAAAPLAEIRDEVAAAWRRDQGFAKAREAAGRIVKRVAAGQSLAAAMRAEKVPLPSPDAINLSREELARAGQVPAPLALLFSMAEGTVKQLAAPGNAGWFVVALEEVEAPQLAADDPLVSDTAAQLGQIMSEEYLDQFVRAVESEVGIERNQVAIDAVIAQLTGRAN